MDRSTLERICLGLKGTRQDIKWGKDLCYLVGEKMFAVTGTEPPFNVCLKVLPEEFEELTERPGIIPAPYLARNKWVLVEDVNVWTIAEWEHYVSQSYELVLSRMSKKAQREIRGE